jgi:hypothetical protein
MVRITLPQAVRMALLICETGNTWLLKTQPASLRDALLYNWLIQHGIVKPR